MSQRKVNKLIIGKEIARTEDLVIEGASQNIAIGEVFVADKYKKVLATAATIATTDTIYIGVGLADTHEYSLPDGTVITGTKRISWSAPIQGTNVLAYTGLSGGTTATERSAKVDITAATNFEPVIGTEYVIRIVYKDINERPGQFTQTFRVTAATTTPADLTNLFLAEINQVGPSGTFESRIIATNDTNDLVLTGKVIPGNASNDEIDEYSQVDFVVGLFSDNFNDCVVTYPTDALAGIGNPKLIRDKEKHARAFEGVTNLVNFPVIKPTVLTDMAKWYDVIVIEHDQEYVSGDNQYRKEAPLTTEIYIPTGAAQTTTDPTSGVDAVQVALNAWMVSLPKAFSSVSV
jgi:hypothetical protein